jgi:hypothetical protein
MHTVEIADSHHGAMQRPNIQALSAVARDMEGRFVHGAIRLLQGISVKPCSIRRHARFLGVCTVTVPLINFQINGLFNRYC